MRWVLVRPRNYSPYYDPEVQEPLGLEYLSSFLNEMGDAVLILDCAMDRMDEIRIARRAAGFQPDVIGFSLTTAQELESVDKIYAEYHNRSDHRTVRWIAGGNFVSTEPEHAARLLPSDILLIKFEGETALAKLAETWQAPEQNRQENFSKHRVICGDPVIHLDQLPFPSRPYARTILDDYGALNVQASRGCCGNCVFCASPGMASKGRNRWRGRSFGRIVDELEMLVQKYGARSFNFIDEDFLGPNRLAAERGKEFAQEILKRRLDITFSIQIRPDSLQLSTIDALAAAGLSYAFMGLETDSQELLKQWHRPIINDPWQFVHRFRERGIEVNVGAMLFHKDATLQSIRSLAAKLDAWGLLDYRSATNRQVAMPGSYLHDQALRKGDLSGEAVGPQNIPCRDAQVESLHSDLLAALAPLGPSSMEAVCALPRVAAQKRLAGDVHQQYANIKRINNMLRQPVMPTLLCLLECMEHGTQTADAVNELRRQNFQISMNGAAELELLGRTSAEELREAIRIDAGM